MDGEGLEDWSVIERMLPSSWQAKAKELGALRRCRESGNASTLLRVMLIHLVDGCSLRETAVRAEQGGLVSVSDVAAVAVVLTLHAAVALATCQTFWNGTTNVQVGQGCFASAVGACPAESNAHDPINFGADSSGVSDSSAAINSAFGARTDIYFGTPGTYLVNLSPIGGTVTTHGIIPPAGTKIECAAGVTLKQTVNTLNDQSIFYLTNNNNTICGCDFQGGQTGSPPFQIGNQGSFLIAISGSSGATVEDSTFERAIGNCAIQLNMDSGTGPSNVTVEYNTYSLLPYYATGVDALVSNITISHNWDIDTLDGAEWDACTSSGSNLGTNILFSNNYLTTSVGDCYQAAQPGGGCVGPGFYGENDGILNGCNEAGLTISNNYCAGTSSVPATIYNNVGSGTAPTISNNYLGAHCSCQSGSSCGSVAPTPMPTPTPTPTPAPTPKGPPSMGAGVLF